MSPSPADDLRALREEAGLYQPDRGALIRVEGEDAADYLQRMTSQDLAGLQPGEARRTCVLNAQGRLLGAPWVWRVDDAFVLELADSARADTLAQLGRYVIADDVRFADAYGQVLRLAGPASEDVSAAVAEGEVLRVQRRDMGPVPGYAWLVLTEGPEEKIVFAATRARLRAVGQEAWDALRVLTRTPAWGMELDAEILPLEARLQDEAVSFSKGCYPGQEPVTMAVHRGHPATLLVRLRIDDGEPGVDLLHDGRAVGRLATCTTLTADDEPNALGFVRYGLAGKALTLNVDGGGQARLLEGEGP